MRWKGQSLNRICREAQEDPTCVKATLAALKRAEPLAFPELLKSQKVAAILENLMRNDSGQ